MGFLDKIFKGMGSASGIPSQQDTYNRVKIGTCVVLLEVAAADDELSEPEIVKIVALLKHRFDLEDEDAKELIAISKEERSKAVDLWKFTNMLNEALTIEQKYQVAEMAWSVIFSDRTLDKFEDHLAHKLISLLNLEHAKFMDIKIRVKKTHGIL